VYVYCLEVETSGKRGGSTLGGTTLRPGRVAVTLLVARLRGSGPLLFLITTAVRLLDFPALNFLALLLPVASNFVHIVLLLNLLGAEPLDGDLNLLLIPELLGSLNVLLDPFVLRTPPNPQEPLGLADGPDVLVQELIALNLRLLPLVEVVKTDLLLLKPVAGLDIADPNLGHVLVTFIISVGHGNRLAFKG